METYGQLKIRMYVAYTQDQHGRATGSWRTLFSRWIDREHVDQQLETFSAANPELNVVRHQLRITFDTSEDLTYNQR
jgi:hypothetical protein